MDAETSIQSAPQQNEPVSTPQQQNILLTCNMCNEQFQSPRALPCLHTYCKTCLSSYIQTKLSELDAGSFPCPDCNESTQPIDPSRPSTEWADGFPENFFLTDMMDLQQGKTDIVDEMMENNTSAATMISKITLKKSKRMSLSESDLLRNGADSTDIRQEILVMKKTEKVIQTQKKSQEDTASSPPARPSASEQKPEEPPKSDNLENGVSLLLPLEYKFSASVPGIECTSMLDSATLMPEGFVLGIDCKNRHVKKFTLTGKLVGLLRLMSEPGDIILLPEGEALLTLPQKCEMISLDPDNSLEITNRLQTPRKYMRLAAGQNERLVASNCVDSMWFVDVLSYNGRVLYSIQRLCIGHPAGITVSPSNDIIITDSIQRAVIAFHWNGSSNFMYRPDSSESDESLEEPRGVCCDSNGRIYLADTKNDRIIRLTYDGHAERILLDSTDGLYRPSSIFVSDNSLLLVTQEDGAVKIYKI